jgi:hypothetical protein
LDDSEPTPPRQTGADVGSARPWLREAVRLLLNPDCQQNAVLDASEKLKANETPQGGLHTTKYFCNEKCSRACGRLRLNQVTARLRKFIRRTRKDHGLHAPFRVTTHRGHTVQMFQSLELAIEAVQSLGPDHYVVDQHGLQIWNPQRKLLRNEE